MSSVPRCVCVCSIVQHACKLASVSPVSLDYILPAICRLFNVGRLPCRMLAPSLFPFATTFIPAVHQPLSCGWWQGIVGRVIGRGGETIRALQQASQAHIVVEQNFPEGVPRKVVNHRQARRC